MKSLKIAVSLVRIPRLFGSLLLFPLLISLVLVYLQMIVTGLIVRTSNPKQIKATMEGMNKKSLARELIYGSSDPLPELKICRWVSGKDPENMNLEVPPSQECMPDRLDAAIQVKSPADFDVSGYHKIFNGNIERLHLCRTCTPDIIVKEVGDEMISEAHSIFAFWILKLVLFNTHIQKEFVEAVEKQEETRQLLGNITLHPTGFGQPVAMTGIMKSLAVIMNIVVLIIVALWLALKAHRKVLDYFARSGALLPMVAATGSQSFYSAIWVLTIFRVGAFLLAALPLTYFGLQEVMQQEAFVRLYSDSSLHFSFWLLAAIVSLGLATLIASIAELKHRHNLLSFTYKYIPLLLAFFGSAIWGASFLVDGDIAHMVRTVTSSIPIVGITPILIAPVFRPQQIVIVLHACLSMTMLIVALKYNARWFAAHLEEI